MSVGRRTARRQAVFILYQQDLLDIAPNAALNRAKDADLDEYARALVAGVATQLAGIDTVLRKHLAGWSLERLGIIERAILRLAAYELFWQAGIPQAVVIDEAVSLAKRFCSDEAGALVNGVLGSLVTTEGNRIAEIRCCDVPESADGKAAR